ncbi:MAG TPA: hypothetical protein VJZ71_01095 [Phycisphaerae bacterium]|nr:hypothetical protein [Phycisphaerae bacterium]
MRSAVYKTLLVTILTAVSATSSLAQSNPGGAFPWEGEVSATNVYVRSGAGSNWYPTTKLNPGDRVLVLGEKFGWYQIAPPAGSFSYVDMAVVDRKAGAKTGTIKQEKVYIRAGSQLESKKSSTQVVLNKGATVEIQGEAEGFFKIAPPIGATLYISKQYVKPVGADLSTGLVERHVSANPPPVETATSDAPPPAGGAIESPVGIGETATPVDPAANISGSGTTPISDPGQAQPVQPPIASDTPTDPNTPAASVEDGPLVTAPGTTESVDEIAAPPTMPKAEEAQKPAVQPAEKIAPSAGRYRAMLDILESELRAVSQKPFDQQNLDALGKRYDEIAAQSDDNVTAQIAKIRARQIRDRAAIRDSRKGLRTDEVELANYRANMDAERMKLMRRRTEAAMVKFDLEGELRKSAVFTSDHRRFRLVGQDSNETIAYVDIPRSVEPDVEHLVGRLVGIHSAGQTFSPSARLPIVVAASVTDLTPRAHIGQDEARPTTPIEPAISPRETPAADGQKATEAKKTAKAPDVDD